MPRVFEYGFTGSDRQKQYSTGMGLYLCKKLCNKMNLDINIESEYKRFTKVKIIFLKTSLYKQWFIRFNAKILMLLTSKHMYCGYMDFLKCWNFNI